MKNPITTALATLALAMTATHAEDTPDANPWRVIESGTSSNIEEATEQVIQSQEEWTAWWNQHNTTLELIDGQEITPPPPAVDFTTETVLVATLGTRTTGGYSIAFTAIAKEGDTLIATLQSTAPDPDGFVTMALTQPYAIIAIPHHPGPIRFKRTP